MSLAFVDDSGETRLSGNIVTGGGATGDVLTQQANKTFAPAPGGGSRPTISETDPGAIGAGGLWIRLDPSQTYPPMLYVRNDANDGWVDMAGAGYLMGLTYYDDNGDVAASVAGSASSIIAFSPGVTLTLGPASGSILADDDIEIGTAGDDAVWIKTTATQIRRNNADVIYISDNLVSIVAGAIGFFGQTPAGRQPAPTTLGDVITGLQNLGLFST